MSDTSKKLVMGVPVIAVVVMIAVLAVVVSVVVHLVIKGRRGMQQQPHGGGSSTNHNKQGLDISTARFADTGAISGETVSHSYMYSGGGGGGYHWGGGGSGDLEVGIPSSAPAASKKGKNVNQTNPTKSVHTGTAGHQAHGGGSSANQNNQGLDMSTARFANIGAYSGETVSHSNGQEDETSNHH